MLSIDQITDHLNRIYDRRRALNRAAAALNLARAVAHLREQFPTAEYAWVQVGASAYESGTSAAEILRVHSVTGSVLWDAEEPEPDDLEPLTTEEVARIWTGPEEIESPATDALVWAYEASESSIPTYPGHEHPVAGVAPATDTGDDPALLTFSHIDKEAERAAFATEVTPVAIPQINNGHPTMVLFAVPSNQVTGIETFDQADAVKLGPPAVVGAEEFPGPLFTRDQVSAAMNSACDDLADHADDAQQGAMDVLVNAALTYLDEPGTDLHEVVERCYDEYPEMLADLDPGEDDEEDDENG